MSIPIPHRPSGFLLGDPAANITIDVFIDIQCPYSRLIWATLVDVLKRYKDDSINLKVHLITVSSHRQAWDINLGLFALAEGDAHKFYDFLNFIYARQEQFYNAPFAYKTHDDLRQLVANFAAQHAGVERVNFINRMDDDDIYAQARIPIRYAAVRCVWATPTIFVNNGTQVPVDHASSLADWEALIDPLLAA
tara:strand:- start:68 stop:646 length:579 start_codon:yes stop_codon:yes gene_type:complete